MALLITPSDLPGPPHSRRFVGADHGGVPISLFLVNAHPGTGAELHRHPYPEIFVLDGGHAEFQIGDANLTASPGEILIAPAGVPHRFIGVGNQRLRLTAIHSAAAMETEWLTSTARPPRSTRAAD